MKKKPPKPIGQRNLVAKHAHHCHKHQVHRDRKKQSKLGYRKHKGQSDPQAAQVRTA